MPETPCQKKLAGLTINSQCSLTVYVVIGANRSRSRPTLHATLASLFQAQGKKNKRNPDSVYTNHITLGKLNARNSGSNEFQKSASVAISSHEARPFNRQKFVSIVSQQYFGRPTRLCPAGCQANILLIQRCSGNVAKYCATFQWCRKQGSDHDLDAACKVNTRTRSFQM